MSRSVKASESFKYLGERVTFRSDDFELTGTLEAVSARGGRGSVDVTLWISGFEVETRGSAVLEVE